MILTGPEICEELKSKEIVIEPFNEKYIEPNSYGFHLGNKLIIYEEAFLDANTKPKEKLITIPPDGHTLLPNHFYLGRTYEKMGSHIYAANLYANRSTSVMGMWIQFSAPLGHTGAIIPWTLEIKVTHPIIIYPLMPIGKISFWKTQGDQIAYQGKYNQSIDVVSSKLFTEMINNNSGGSYDFNR